jgi:hypothetical protein
LVCTQSIDSRSSGATANSRAPLIVTLSFSI